MNDEIKIALQSCAENFREVVSHLDRDDLHSTRFPPLRDAWHNYYRTHFSELDRLIRSSVEAGEEDTNSLVPLSISHHNLDRLMEVLHHDVKDQTLGTTHIPERTVDLLEVLTRLEDLLDTICATHFAPTNSSE